MLLEGGLVEQPSRPVPKCVAYLTQTRRSGPHGSVARVRPVTRLGPRDRALINPRGVPWPATEVLGDMAIGP